MSKRDIILFIFKWKYSLLGYFLLIVGLATVLVYALPQKYTARATLLIDSNRAPTMRADAALGLEQLTVLTSEISIIRSKTVLSGTVDKVGVVESRAPTSRLEAMIDSAIGWMEEVGLKEVMSARDRMIRSLEKDLVVEPLANSSVIAIEFTGKNSERVTEIVNALTDTYIDHHLKVFSDAGTSEVFLRQLNRLEKELNSKRNELARYKQESSVAAVAESKRALVESLSGHLAEAGELRLELSELGTRYSPEHVKIVLAKERLAAVNDTIVDVEKQLQELETQETEIKEKELAIAALERNIIDYQRRYEQERLNELANREVVNVRIIEYASVANRPDHSRIFYIALAMAGGLILTIVIAVVKEYFDHRVTDPNLATDLLGIPNFGSVEWI